MRFGLKPLLATGAVVVLASVVLAPIAGATSSSTAMMPTPMPRPTSSMMPTPTPSPSSTTPPGGGGASWCGGGIWNGGGAGAWGGTGMWGMGSGIGWLTSNPAALQAWLQLRADHLKAVQAWHDSYKTDLTSAAAQQALHTLWTSFWNDMKAFYQQYGNGTAWTCPSGGMWGGWQTGGMMGSGSWNASHMWGAGYGASWMTSHTRGFGNWLTMRGRQTTAMRGWQQRYASNLRSATAQTALRTLTMHNRTQVKSFYRHHGMATTSHPHAQRRRRLDGPRRHVGRLRLVDPYARAEHRRDSRAGGSRPFVVRGYAPVRWPQRPDQSTA